MRHRQTHRQTGNRQTQTQIHRQGKIKTEQERLLDRVRHRGGCERKGARQTERETEKESETVKD